MNAIYRFLTEDDTSEFCLAVSEALSKGWKHYGDPSYRCDSRMGRLRWGLAVIRLVDTSYSKTMKLGEQ